jgi:predicted nuclease with TOPRIM domain
MIWNATMPVWVALVIIAALVLLAVAMILYAAFIAGRHDLKRAHIEERLITQRDEARMQRDKINRENMDLRFDLNAAKERLKHLDAQLADRNEALQEAQAEIKALQMNTIEVQEVAPERKPIRRNMSKKAETKQ